MSVFYAHDDIELANRGHVQRAARQWQQATQTTRKAVRKAHVTFLWKVYIISVCLATTGAAQWYAVLSSRRWTEYLVKKSNFIIPALVFINLLLMSPIRFILHSTERRRKLVEAIYVLVIMQTSSFILSWPFVLSSVAHLTKAVLFCIFVVAASLSFALVYHFDMDQDYLYLALWALRYFLTTATCLLLTLTFDNRYVNASISFVLLFFITIFILIFGRSIGSFEFYRGESTYISLYITLMYLNVVSLLVSSLVFFQNIEVL